MWWLKHARAAFPHAKFIAKADDDVYRHLPDIEALLLDPFTTGAYRVCGCHHVHVVTIDSA